MIRVAHFDELKPRELYGILRLRIAVFIVEQECVYTDLDGRDLEPSTLQVWLEQDGAIVSSLRVLDNGDVRRIGRVCTHPSHRGRGLAAQLIEHVIDTVGAPLFLGAQTHLQRYYERFGFRVCGDVWDENGIPHLPMRLESDIDPRP